MLIKSTLVLSLLAFAMPASNAVNVLTDPSFEGSLNSGPAVSGIWNAFGGAPAVSEYNTNNPRTGAQHLHLDMDTNPFVFTGVYQDVNVMAGDQVTFTGWHLAMTDGGVAGIEVTIEWHDLGTGGGQISVSRIEPEAGFDYEMFTLTDTAPTGVDTARIVYSLQSFSGAKNASVHADDFSVVVVPEPGAGALLALGMLGLSFRRSRKS